MPIGGGGSGGGGSGIRAGRAFIEVSLAGVRGVVGGLEAVRRNVLGAASAVGRIGAAGGILGGAAGGLFAKLGLDKIQDLAKQGAIADSLGLTAEQFTGIAGIAKAAGEDTKEFIESLVTLGKVASEGALGKGEVAADFFKAINVNAKEFQALRADEQFFQFFEAVRQVEDPLQRVRALMTAFGEDGGKLLLPLLSKAPDELRAMAAGFSSTTEDIRQAQAAQVAFAGASAQLDKAWRSVVIGMAPAVERAADAFGRAVEPAIRFVSENKELVAVGIGVAGAAAAAAAAVGALTPALGSVVAAIGPMNIALGVAVGKLLQGTKAGDELADVWGSTFTAVGAAAGEAFQGLREDFTNTWQGLSDALKSGDIARAAEVGFAAIEVAWARTLKMLREQWERFKFALKESKDAAYDGVARGITSTFGDLKATAAVALSNLPKWAGGPNPADREKMINQTFQKIQAEENRQLLALNEAAQAAARQRKDDFEKALTETLREDSERVERAAQVLAAAVAGGKVGSGAMALGGGMLAGVGTPRALAQDVANFFEDRFPRRGGGTALQAALGGFGAIPQATANRLNAAADATRVAATRGIFGGGNGMAAQIFGGGSPLVMLARQELAEAKAIKNELAQIKDRLREMDGGEFT